MLNELLKMENSPDVLKQWLKIAENAESIDDFRKN